MGKLPYDIEKDFVPISFAAMFPVFIVAHPSVPANTIQELIALAKKGTPLAYGSSGNGGGTHLAGELFKARTGIFMTHIPYRGSGPAMSDMLAGNTDVMFDNLPSAMPHIQSGSLKAFAVTSAVRSAALPDLPTVAEAGGLPGFEASSWFGLLAPAGTPPDTVNRIQQAVAKALNVPAIKERLTAQGAIPSGDTPQAFSGLIAAEIAKWAPVVKASGARVD
jgi:tripartite-type tricarboxylate transporter receptor subunit TctC